MDWNVRNLCLPCVHMKSARSTLLAPVAAPGADLRHGRPLRATRAPPTTRNGTIPNGSSRWDNLSDIRDADELQAQPLNEMLEIFYNDPPWLLLYFQPDFYGVSDRLDWDPRRDEVIDLVNASLAQ